MNGGKQQLSLSNIAEKCAFGCEQERLWLMHDLCGITALRHIHVWCEPGLKLVVPFIDPQQPFWPISGRKYFT